MSALDGRTAIVTGAAAGVGAACARRLAEAGARVALVDRADCGPVIAGIAAEGGIAREFRCDLADAEDIATLMPLLRDWRRGGIILLNAAETYPETPLATLTLERWQEVFAINLDSAVALALGLVPAMKAEGWGRIVNFASSTVTLPGRDAAAAIASKMGIIGLTRALASDLGPFGITVNAISPGLMDTADDHPGQIAKGQPVGRAVVPDDVAGLALFLAGDGSAMMTGQTLLVDGGLSRL